MIRIILDCCVNIIIICVCHAVLLVLLQIAAAEVVASMGLLYKQDCQLRSDGWSETFMPQAVRAAAPRLKRRG